MLIKEKKCGFGILSASTTSKRKYVTPEWVFEAGAEGRVIQATDTWTGTKEQVIPVWTDEIFLQKLTNFIQALAERYDGNESIAYIDIRSYGNWGEQHLGLIGGEYLSANQLQELYITPYKEAFKKTLLINPWGDKRYNTVYEWSIDNGVSIRRDGIFKYSDGMECNMAYGKLPSIFEFTSNYKWMLENNLWSQEALLQYMENGKPSYIQFDPSLYANNKEFCHQIGNKMGYYFKLKEVTFSDKMIKNEKQEVDLNFVNEGVAPLYEPCTVYIGLMDQNYQLVKKIKTEIDPHTWKPNERIQEQLSLSIEEVQEGDYILALGFFLNEDDEKPTYLLGNSNKTEDNWYALGKVKVENPQEEYNIKNSDDHFLINGYDNYESDIQLSYIKKDSTYTIDLYINQKLVKTIPIDSSEEKVNQKLSMNFEEGLNNFEIQIKKDNQIQKVQKKEVYVCNVIRDVNEITGKIVGGYENFEHNFYEEIREVHGLVENIENLKGLVKQVKNGSQIQGYQSIKLMEEHYDLGRKILKAIPNRQSLANTMLEQLDEIGQWYDNLVSISLVSTEDLNSNETEESIYKVLNLINDNQNLEMVYAKKIIESSQLYFEKAVSIYRIEEENDLKIGLTVSKNLHAKLLADWAEQFANLYVDEYIEANPMTLNYSETNLTNQNVIVTLSAPYDFQVTNNQQNKTYTFTQNGNFTFHYLVRGQAKEILATVTNIDKTPPTITGVEEGRLYFDEAKPIVKDENLQEVKLIVNDQVFENYEINTTIQVEGIYQIVATDKAGNQTKVSFEIIQTPELDYQFKEDKIVNIKNNTTKSTFDETIKINSPYQIKRNTQMLADTDKIATGDILETQGGQTYTLVVAGDINKDGEVGAIDLVKMRKYLLGEIQLNEIEKLAADANVDGKTVGIQDLVRLRILILSKENS